MIFTSLGLLLVSLGLLVAGIAKSSVALLMASLVCTVVAGVVLATVLPATRRLQAATGTGGPWSGPGMQLPNGQPVVLYVHPQPQPSSSPSATAEETSPIDLRDAAPIVGYESMTAQQITKLIASGALTDEQLEAMRRYEEAHGARKSVLAKLS